jgi:molybdopterin-containing oxidoreductase family membrane subunit
MSELTRFESRSFYPMAALGGLISLTGLAAALYMEHEGHAVTGMTNEVVWGLPHIVAFFLIIAASGVLNIASMGSVFGKPMYKIRAPLSGLLSLSMLAGGLAILMLDLGRADRIIVAATHFNPTSVFGWNMVLYPGMFSIVAVYLWTMMDRPMKSYSKLAGLAAFVWRVLLTTGTGSVLAFLVARQAYGSSILAPMFIVMSFAWGLAVFVLVQAAMFNSKGISLPPLVQKRMKHLLGLFVAAVLYFLAVQHLTNAYFSRNIAFEKFLLVESGFAPVFWVGQVLVGGLIPLAMLYSRVTDRTSGFTTAALLVVVGAFSQLYVLIIGGQAYPLDIFPGYEVTSSFFDGQVTGYTPRLPEILLALGGVGIAFTVTTIGVRVLRFMPEDDLSYLEVAAKSAD